MSGRKKKHWYPPGMVVHSRSGAPAKLTEPLADLFFKAYAQSGSINSAARFVGVNPQTVHEWIRRGEQSTREPYHEFASRFLRVRGEHGLKMVGTLQAIGLGGMYQKPAMEVYVDNNGRQWQTNKVLMEEELEHDAEGNVIPLLAEDGRPMRDPKTGLPRFMPRIDPKTEKPFMRPVMTWAHRDPDANTLKWLLSHQYADEFADAPEHAVSITAITNDATVQTIAARVEAYQKKMALAASEPEAIKAESTGVLLEGAQQEDNAELQEKNPTGASEK
jgi:hypothetical protein